MDKKSRVETSWPLDTEKWSLDQPSASKDKESQLQAIPQNEAKLIEILQQEQQLVVKNNSAGEISLSCRKEIVISNVNYKNMQITFKGQNLLNAAGCLRVNGHPVPLNASSNMEINPPASFAIKLTVPANSAICIEEIMVVLQEAIPDFTDFCNTTADVLVITPNYPSTYNLYLCAFAHSRNREYAAQGLKIQVAAISPNNWYQTVYDWDGVPVFCGTYLDLKTLLSRHQYKVIVTHFVDELLYPIFDGYVQDEQLIFICHGPETTFRFLTNVCRPYFTKPSPAIDTSTSFDMKEMYVKKYAQKDNVEWVFVSDWLKEFSKELLGIEFRHERAINNIINQDLFPYHEKIAEDRKKILIIRKFDNISVHSIDQSVRAILVLSKRPFFKELTFEVYGDGNYYDVLVSPLRQFKNVHLHKTFIPNNDMHKIYAQNGIFLIPARHDSHGVAMGEAASSGLAVVGSKVTSTGFFMNQAANHTLADPENPSELAEIIERLYNNPDEFLAISKRMSAETQKLCNKGNTTTKEVMLIREKLSAYVEGPVALTAMPSTEPILTIAVPSYNVEKYLGKCLHSLIMHRNVAKTEILVINDGSTDHTLNIARKFEQATNGIVRVIDKENGGHGSTVNIGIEQAKGKYFRLIDSDDWVDGENLAKLIDLLENETADVVLTKGCYEYIEQAQLTNIINYDMLNEGVLYYFEELVYPGYGFDTYGPLLTTGNYRTECLKKADFKLSEKKPYVDMEFNAFSLRYINTLRYFDLDIYRYLIGREGQTISRDFWRKKYKDHRFIIFNILKTLQQMSDYSATKKKYVYEHIIALLIDSQIFMYDQLCLWSEIDPFLDELAQWPQARDAGLKYITAKNGECKIVMSQYRTKLSKNRNMKTPIIGDNRETHKNLFWILKKMIKACVPQGILKLYQNKKYPNGF